jgi:hypothetical protein
VAETGTSRLWPGSIVTFGIAASVGTVFVIATVTFTFAELVPLATLIVAVPLPRACTSPSAVTVATAVLLLR